jgi:hypothetical protein
VRVVARRDPARRGVGEGATANVGLYVTTEEADSRPCSPPVGAVSFLGAGSYQAVDGAGSPFAWTYSTGHCEYWAMDNTISTGTNVQSPFTPAYTSLSQFETSVCALSPAPSTWYTVDYLPDTHFCSAPRC